MNQIGSAVLTFIGYKQLNKQSIHNCTALFNIIITCVYQFNIRLPIPHMLDPIVSVKSVFR